MKVFQIQDGWSMDHLQLASRPDPVAGPREVLLKMKAASLNYRDQLVPLRGYGSFTGELPLIPVSDGVGEVVAVGEGVTRFKVGERVCPHMMQKWIAGEPSLEIIATLGGPIDGVMAEYRAFSEEAVVRAPEHLTDEEAATLPCAALTAWSAIVTYGNIKPGERVLIQGTGGVSLFALQFAKLAGAHVTVISSTEEKMTRAKVLGADGTLNYKASPEWAKALRPVTQGKGFDHIVEVGGAKTLPQSLRAIRPGGTISMIGVLSGATMEAQLGLIVTRQVRLQGISVGHREGFEAMCRAISQHRLKPVVDRVFAFDDLKPALAHLASGAHFGKVCIRHQA